MAGDRLLEEDLARLAPREEGAPDEAAAPVPAHVALRLSADDDGRTFLAAQHVRYPFHVGRSLHAAGDPQGMPTYYVQCCSGGMFDGDRLRWNVVAEAGAQVHLTSSASTIVHAARSDHALQEVEIEAHAGSLVEYLPDPLILLPAARLATVVRVRAHPSAAVLVWDPIVAHDHTGGGACFDWIDATLRIETPDGRLRARDRYRLPGATFSEGLPGVTGAFGCQAGFAAVAPLRCAQDVLLDVRTALACHVNAYAAASLLPDAAGLWIRVLASDAHVLRAALYSAWSAVRCALLGSPPSPRRK